MNAFKKQCINLRRSGHTLTEITKITGRPKTSVYSHIHNIPLTKERLRLIKIASGIRAKNLALAKKGTSKNTFYKFNKWNEETVTLVAHLLFDGTINKTGCAYNNRNMSLIKAVEESMSSIYDYEPKRYLNNLTGVSRITYHNVALSNYLESKAKKLLLEIELLPKSLKKVFVRAFFNDEGCIDFRPKRNLRQIRGYQKNISILHIIHNLLTDFQIESKIVTPNEIVIIGKNNLIQFRNEINFSSGVRLNGKRSNSIWKKSLEKRALLDQAIKSFKN